MAREPKAFWHKENKCWCSCIGEISEKSGRRKPVYFRDIPNGPKGSPNYRKAQAKVAEILAGREEKIVRSSEPTIGVACSSYLQWLIRRVDAGKAKPLTLKGHTAALRKFKEYEFATGRQFKDMLVRDLTATVMARFIGSLAGADRGEGKPAGHAPNYIARIVGSVQAVLNWAAEPVAGREPERLIAENPIKGFKHEATRAPHPPDRYAPGEEVRAFLDWGYKRAATYVRVGNRVNRFGDIIMKGGDLERRFEKMTIDLINVAYLTGTRPGELRVAEWTDFEPRVERVEGIDDWCGRIKLTHERWKSGSKTGRARDVLLTPEAVGIILAIQALPDHHPRFIFTHRRGSQSQDRDAITKLHGVPWNESSLPNKICTLRRQAILDGVPILDRGENRFVMYRLRHSRAAELLMDGVPVATVARVLGTSIQMIETVYASFLEAHLAEAITRRLSKERKAMMEQQRASI